MKTNNTLVGILSGMAKDLLEFCLHLIKEAKLEKDKTK
jgi:hypothetical protein